MPILWRLFFACLVVFLSASGSADITLSDIARADVQPWFSAAITLDKNSQAPGYRLVYADRQVVGAVLLTNAVKPIPGYSGKPIATLVAIDTLTKIVGLNIVQHEEPILVVGIKEQDLTHFTQQYSGIYALDKVRVNASNRPGYVGIDGISGATITAMVLNRSIMSSVKAVAKALSWPEQSSDLLLQTPPLASQQKPQAEKPTTTTAAQNSVNADRWEERLEPWKEQPFKVILLSAALLLLLGILFFQDWLVRHPRLFRPLRTGFQLFTVVFIGYVFAAQLSIVNVLAFIQTFNHGFTWETLMIDPGLFLLWSFVAISILLWGRGVFCGWLCPFGAIQELLHELALKLKVPTFEFPPMVHERLWAIKYFILILLVGISLDSFSLAASLAEVEPFKTSLTMHFARQWGYVAYAVGLLIISLFNSKFFCKYLCALGASLSIIGRVHIFDWLRRRNECGKPCQTCAAQCQISAVKPTGDIISSECHYCMECQLVYWDEHACPPLVEKRKKRQKREQNALIKAIELDS